MEELDRAWNSIKDAFMTEEEKERRRKKKENFEKEEKKLIDELSRMDAEWRKYHGDETDFSKYFDEDLGLVHKDYVNEDRDDMADIARRKYGHIYDDAKAKIYKDSEEDYKSTNSDIEDIYDKERKALINLADRYKESKRNARDRYVKNGILDSSIADLNDEDIDGEHEYRRSIVEDEARDKVKDKKDNLARLNKERDEALAKLDIKKASKIDEEIDKLVDSAKRTNDRVRTYNNNVNQRERDYDIRRNRLIGQLTKSELQQMRKNGYYEKYNGYFGEKARQYDRRAKLVFDFYKQLPRDEAVKAMKNNYRLRTLLGKEFNKLVQIMASR